MVPGDVKGLDGGGRPQQVEEGREVEDHGAVVSWTPDGCGHDQYAVRPYHPDRLGQDPPAILPGHEHLGEDHRVDSGDIGGIGGIGGVGGSGGYDLQSASGGEQGDEPATAADGEHPPARPSYQPVDPGSGGPVVRF